MKPSPVQLLRIWFQKVSVELDEHHAPPEPASVATDVFSFEGVTMKTSVGIAEMEGSTSGAHVYQITSELIVDNKKNKASKHQRFCPYLLGIKTVGVVRVPADASKLAPVRDLALVNGAALMWAAMREQLATVTSRMPAGQILLPSVHFQDLRSDAPNVSTKLAHGGGEPAALLAEKT